MTPASSLTPVTVPVRERATLPVEPGVVDIWWLGQAGFLLRGEKATIVIDPYLSDTLARKYAGSEFAHIRMMEAPILPRELDDADLLLCTHRHTDHMDPGTLPGILSASPGAPVVVPRAVRDQAVARGVPSHLLVEMNAGEAYASAHRVCIHAVPAAHEQLELDERGNHRYLGYVIEFGDCTVYHSGDTVPYAGLYDWLAGFDIDLALLPVNGRDEYRRSRGVPGNMSAEEAVNLAFRLGVRYVIGHHYGMFEFNTVEPNEANERIQTLIAQQEAGRCDCRLAESGVVYRLHKTDM